MTFPDAREIETEMALLVGKGLCSNARTLHCKEIENSVFYILFPKWNPITIGVFYRLPNQADFMELMVEKFPNLNLKDNQKYPLGDFNINIF